MRKMKKTLLILMILISVSAMSAQEISLSVKALFAPEPAEEPVAEEAASEEEDADVVSVDIDAVIAAETATEAEE